MKIPGKGGPQARQRTKAILELKEVNRAIPLMPVVAIGFLLTTCFTAQANLILPVSFVYESKLLPVAGILSVK